MINATTVAEVVRLLATSPLSVREIARRCGIDDQTVVTIEQGRHAFQIVTVRRPDRVPSAVRVGQPKRPPKRGAEMFQPQSYLPTPAEIRRKCLAIHRLGRMRGLVRAEDRPTAVYFRPVNLRVG